VSELLPKLKGGAAMRSRTLTLFAPEGDVARRLGAIQAEHPEVEIGSYPFWRPEGPSCSIVVRGTDQAAIDRVIEALYALAGDLGCATQEDYKPD
jgi:molybdopterin-biosynthesis enzyme MoeA-like protein